MAELELRRMRMDVGGFHGGLDDPAYVPLNPNQRIPTLVDGSVFLWISNAICRYLVDTSEALTALEHETQTLAQSVFTQRAAKAGR